MSPQTDALYTETPQARGPLEFLCALVLVITPMAFQARMIAQTEAPPSATEQTRIIELLRRYAAGYHEYDDIVYDRTEVFAVKGTWGKKKWHKEFTDSATWMEHNGHQFYRTEGWNGKPKWKPGVRYGGTDLFKALAREGTEFAWDRWDIRRGRRCATLHYSIDSTHSQYVLLEPGIGHAIVPYQGSVCADPETGTIWYLSTDITQIPAQFRYKHEWDTVDYDVVTIGATQHVVAVANAQCGEQKDGTALCLNRTFRNFHKFEAASSVTYGSPQ